MQITKLRTAAEIAVFNVLVVYSVVSEPRWAAKHQALPMSTRYYY